MQHIEYNSSGVTVTTRSNGVFTGQYAIVTVPLAVLKSGTIEFTPALPASKRASIERLQIGTDNKIYYRFPRIFWETDSTFTLRVSQHPGKWAGWINANLWLGQPVLAALLEGDSAIRMEELSDDRLVDLAMEHLREMYGSSIPEPDALLRSHWHSDPFSRGTYAHIPVGGTHADAGHLGQPVDGRLFFAGEATSVEYPSSVRGAYLTGRREAQRVLSGLGIS